MAKKIFSQKKAIKITDLQRLNFCIVITEALKYGFLSAIAEIIVKKIRGMFILVKQNRADV